MAAPQPSTESASSSRPRLAARTPMRGPAGTLGGIRSLLVEFDGNTRGMSQIDLAVTWAQAFDAKICGLGVVDPDQLIVPEPIPPGGSAYKLERDRLILTKAKEAVAKGLGDLDERCRQQGVSCKIDRDIATDERQVLDGVNRHDVIITGRRLLCISGQAGEYAHLRRLVMHCPRPVVSVAADPTLAAGACVTSPNAQRAHNGPIVIATDGSLQASRTVQLFQAMGLSALACGGGLHVVSVNCDRGQARHRAEDVVAFLRLHDVPAEGVPLASGKSPASELLDYVAGVQASLLVIGAYGRSGFLEFFLGSTTRSLLAGSSAPVFLSH
jgi:nucleotide-binding universal stress UspA family protein